MGRLSKKMLMMVMGRKQYYQKIMALFGNSFVGYYPLWESTGVVANDISGNARNGAYSNVTLANKTGATGFSVPLFVPANSSYVNLYSAGFSAAFNGQAGTLMAAVQVSAASVWTDGAQRNVARFAVDGNNSLSIKKGGDNSLSFGYTAGAVVKNKDVAISATSTIHVVMTWDLAADQKHVYINGVEQGAVETGLGTWAGVLGVTQAVIAAYSTGAAQLWDGWISDVVILNRAATQAEVTASASPF